MKKFIFLIAFCAISISAFAQIGTHISSTRLPPLETAWWSFPPNEQVLPWQNAGCLNKLKAEGGLEVTLHIDVTQDLPGIDGLSQEIMDKINDNTIENILFYFPPGLYEFEETIDLTNRSNIIFKGAGAENTTLHFTYDYIKYVWGNYTVGWEYDNSFVISNSSNIGFEDFKINNSPNLIQTIISTTNKYIGGTYFAFSNSDHCWISGVHSYDAQRHHISIGSGNSNIEVRGCYIDKSNHRGNGGNGYGVVIGHKANRCLVENNVFRKLRHSMIFGDSTFYNVLGYNYSRENDSQGSTYNEPTDICFHGHSSHDDGPEFNLVEGNIANFIQFDKAWEENGINNLIFRNRAPKIADWDLNPLYPNNDNDDQIIVNGYMHNKSEQLNSGI